MSSAQAQRCQQMPRYYPIHVKACRDWNVSLLIILCGLTRRPPVDVNVLCDVSATLSQLQCVRAETQIGQLIEEATVLRLRSGTITLTPAAYSPGDALLRDTVSLRVVDQGLESFPAPLVFSVRLWFRSHGASNFTNFLRFFPISLYKIPKTYLTATSRSPGVMSTLQNVSGYFM